MSGRAPLPTPESLQRRWWLNRRVVIAALIDSRTVRLFQIVMYVCFGAAGLYAIYYARPPEPVDQVVGHSLYILWGWICFLSAFIALIGFLPSMSREVRERNLATRSKTSKVMFQLGGDVGMFGVLAVYAYSMWTTGYWHVSPFAFFETLGLNACVGLLIVGDIRALAKSEWM